MRDGTAVATAPVQVRVEAQPRPGIRVKRLVDGVDECWSAQVRNVWIDVETPSEQDLASLNAHFELNPLAIEDALEIGHWGRFEVYPEHLFLIFRTLAEPLDLTKRTERVSIFWYPELNTLITFRNEPIDYLEAVWHELRVRLRQRPIDVIYALVQRGTDTFFSFLDALDDQTDALEERAVNGERIGAQSDFASRVFELKHTVIGARRLVSSAREDVAQFARHVTMLESGDSILMRDASDHLARVYEGIDSARDILTNLLDVHLSVQSNRMNEVMKTLTTVSTIFLPLTFLAGVWGMNFVFIPELKWTFGYAFAWLSFIAVGLSLAIYFKRRGYW